MSGLGSLAESSRWKDAGNILREYPNLDADDLAEALSYVAGRAKEVEVILDQR